ncbi:hypothetical protein KUCAC02_028567 [Chaenocephalus aceratus]|uniref:Uncharacterized protein n=1 Tax=Chaenocephalus aceratus TaxID=36190 RepID=A0ACB9X489_CHAAC|nr:hypothetical protein KUCAC02_028567 [Chaenocephalus aceratus]
MTENGENSPLHHKNPVNGDAAVNSRTLKTSLVDAKSSKEHKDALKVNARNAEGEFSPYQPRPPPQPRLSSKSVSVEETLRTRRLKNSQESLSDPVETGSSSDSLKEDLTALAQEGAVSLIMGGRPRSQQSDPTDLRARPSKVLLSPVQPTGKLPALEKGFASATLKAANRIDGDCLDYAVSAKEKPSDRLHRNLSDSRLLENRGSDSASVHSMRSNYSVLSPIRPQDVRNRSFLEGSVLGSGALLGAEELDRHFPDRKVGIYIATWNMQGEKGLPTNLDDLLLPTDSEFDQDFYIIGVQEGCPDRREWEVRLQETLGPLLRHAVRSSTWVFCISLYLSEGTSIWFCSEVEHATVQQPGSSLRSRPKGAVGIAFTFFGTSFLFITSHFTSGDSKVYERVLDYNKIIEALALPKGLPDTNPYRSTSSDVTTRFDQVFWLEILTSG